MRVSHLVVSSFKVLYHHLIEFVKFLFYSDEGLVYRVVTELASFVKVLAVDCEDDYDDGKDDVGDNRDMEQSHLDSLRRLLRMSSRATIVRTSNVLNRTTPSTASRCTTRVPQFGVGSAQVAPTRLYVFAGAGGSVRGQRH